MNFYQLKQLDRVIRDFIQDPMLKSIPFEPMIRIYRQQFHTLATFYGLKSESKGSGLRRYPIITKTNKTCLMSKEEAEKIIQSIISSYSTNSNSSEKNNKETNNKKKNLAKRSIIVGEYAPPIGEDNFGNKLMRSMGWLGGGLGINGQGIEKPIETIIKKDRKGLGCQ
jgi:hypothetical protein